MTRRRLCAFQNLHGEVKFFKGEDKVNLKAIVEPDGTHWDRLSEYDLLYPLSFMEKEELGYSDNDFYY